MPCSTQNHIQFNVGFKWVLFKLFSQVIFMTLDTTIFKKQLLSWKKLWVSDIIVPNIICFQTQKQLTTLNSIGVLLKRVLIDLCAYNFVHAKTSSHAHCMHTCNHMQNLSSAVMYQVAQKKLYGINIKVVTNTTGSYYWIILPSQLPIFCPFPFIEPL